MSVPAAAPELHDHDGPRARDLVVRRLGRCAYQPVWRAMQRFTAGRNARTGDELWLVEHPPVYTLGRNAGPAHLLNPGDIPVIDTDRGGQVTYHGPGQVVVYCLLDLRRRGIGVRHLVETIEQSIIDLVAGYGIDAHGRRDAPGVYVNDSKLAAVGLRIRHGCSYHGLSLNVAMDLEPFSRINPCGYPGLAVTQLQALGGPGDVARAGAELIQALTRNLDALYETPRRHGAPPGPDPARSPRDI